MEATRSNRWRQRDRTDGGDAIEPEPPSSEELIHDGSAQGKGGDAEVAKRNPRLRSSDDDSRFGDSQIDQATSRSKSHKSILGLAIHGAILGLKMRRHRREGGDEPDLIAGQGRDGGSEGGGERRW
ncbi:hypothetical protein U1Q18_018192 [Sarracenia purpurea var. burkii]